MMAFLQNNPTLAAIAGVVVLITIALHVGVYLVIRKLSRAKAQDAEEREDSAD